MDMPEPWVILIFVELFWSVSLSYFAENAQVVIFHQNLTVPWVIFPLIWQKIWRQIELFPQKAWVIFKTSSYFCSKILKLFLKCRKKKPEIIIIQANCGFLNPLMISSTWLRGLWKNDTIFRQCLPKIDKGTWVFTIPSTRPSFEPIVSDLVNRKWNNVGQPLAK